MGRGKRRGRGGVMGGMRLAYKVITCIRTYHCFNHYCEVKAVLVIECDVTPTSTEVPHPLTMLQVMDTRSGELCGVGCVRGQG